MIHRPRMLAAFQVFFLYRLPIVQLSVAACKVIGSLRIIIIPARFRPWFPNVSDAAIGSAVSRGDTARVATHLRIFQPLPKESWLGPTQDDWPEGS